MSQSNDVWVYLETNADEVETVGYEMLGKARDLANDLGTEVTAVLVGSGTELDRLGETAITRGADRALVIAHDLLAEYRPETFTAALADAVQEETPGILLIGATHNGIDLAGRLAVRLDAGLTADVTRLEIDDSDELVGGVPAFAGGILAMVKATGSLPQMSTVRPGVFNALPSDDSRDGTVETVTPTLSEADIQTEILDRSVGEMVDLPSADVVIALGRGVDGDITVAEELAEYLSATVGVTRPLCDDGVVSRDHQIGTTGYSLKADLVIVAGVSGAVHFTAGIEDCGTVIAINSDPEAPIFDHADYCVDGDLFEVLPALRDALETEGVVA